MTTSDPYPGTATETGAEQQPDTLVADFIRGCFAQAQHVRAERLTGKEFLEGRMHELLQEFANNIASLPENVATPDGYANFGYRRVEYTEKTFFGERTQIYHEPIRKPFWLLRKGQDYSGRPLMYSYSTQVSRSRSAMPYEITEKPACIIVTSDGKLYKVHEGKGDLEKQMAFEQRRAVNRPVLVAPSDLFSPEHAVSADEQQQTLYLMSTDIQTVIQRAVIPA